MTPGFQDRMNVWIWVTLIVLGAVLGLIGWYRYFTPLS
jgi:hypothetical protein